MIETLRLEFHPLAQPIRSAAGFLVACYPPATNNRFTLLVDLGSTDKRPDWELMPDSVHRVLLMLDSPLLIRLELQLPHKAERTLKLKERTCRITLLRGERSTAESHTGYWYDLRIECHTKARDAEASGHEVTT